MRAKGQSQIIQFIMFFMIGLALFLTIGGVFRGRLDIFTGDIADQNRHTINAYFSAIAVDALYTCKQCDNFNLTTKLANTTAGSFTQVGLNSTNLFTVTQPGNTQYVGQVHNVLLQLAGAGGLATSNKPVVVRYSRTLNTMTVLSG